MPGDGLLAEDLLGAVSTAVLSTLYGLLVAHLLILPLARRIERRGEEEERARAEMFIWLKEQLRDVGPQPVVKRLHAVGPEEAA